MTKLTVASVVLALAAGSAFAADLPSRKAPILPPPPAPTFTWTGLYGGVNIGYGFGNSNSETGSLGYIGAGAPLGSAWSVPQDLSGVLGGGQVGYNYQFSPWLVVGLEADIQASDVHSTVNAVNALPDFGGHVQSVNSTKSVDWFGTVRGRIGFTPFMPNLLIFGSGGFAYGGVVHNASFADNFAGGGFAVGSANYDDTKVGWTAGGGIEWSPTQFPAFSVKVEYLYVDLGSTNLNTVSVVSTPGFPFAANHNSPTQFHVVRAGLNWHFNPFAPAPVVAKY